jgi:hypothetical protein
MQTKKCELTFCQTTCFSPLLPNSCLRNSQNTSGTKRKQRNEGDYQFCHYTRTIILKDIPIKYIIVLQSLSQFFFNSKSNESNANRTVACVAPRIAKECELDHCLSMGFTCNTEIWLAKIAALHYSESWLAIKLLALWHHDVEKERMMTLRRRPWRKSACGPIRSPPHGTSYYNKANFPTVCFCMNLEIYLQKSCLHQFMFSVKFRIKF